LRDGVRRAVEYYAERGITETFTHLATMAPEKPRA
jgi:hypothetical protein